MDRRVFSTGLMACLSGVAILAHAGAKADLSQRFAEIEKASGARLGVLVLDTGSGMRAGHREDERFPMCSTFKFVAAAAILARVDQQKERLDRRVAFNQRDVVDYSPV